MNKFTFLFVLLGASLFSGCNWTSKEKKEETTPGQQEVPAQSTSEEKTPPEETVTPEASEVAEITEEAKTMATGKITKIKTEEDFNKIFDSNKLVIKFKTKGCPVCKKMRPLFKKMAINNPDITFATIDVNNKNLKTIIEKYFYETKGTPTFVFIKTQGVKATIPGQISEKDFNSNLEALR
ncbi:thioredoxin family protein [Candidatus Babeliales bacterium]|nr:thioredoxin family protein [Candidatus Babeliales bacterium]MCF7899088.1 thioredoxin family protein [Candidatus Babeliales bacterium]